MSQIQNTDGILLPTAEVTSLIEQTTKARITEIYLCLKKIFARYFGLQYCEPSSGAERKSKSEKHKRIVTKKDLKYKMRDTDWLFRTKLRHFEP